MSDSSCKDNVQYPQLLEQIICDCGHSYDEHVWKCRHRVDATVYNCDGLITAYECPCNEDKRSVELRWRLKRTQSERDDYMKERDAYMKSYEEAIKENDKLRGKINERELRLIGTCHERDDFYDKCNRLIAENCNLLSELKDYKSGFKEMDQEKRIIILEHKLEIAVEEFNRMKRAWICGSDWFKMVANEALKRMEE